MSAARSALAYVIGFVATVFALLAILFGVMAGAVGHVAGLLISRPSAPVVDKIGLKAGTDMELT